MAKVVTQLAVVYDAAKRGVKDCPEYADAAQDGTLRGRIIVVASSHRAAVPPPPAQARAGEDVNGDHGHKYAQLHGPLTLHDQCNDQMKYTCIACVILSLAARVPSRCGNPDICYFDIKD